MTDLEEIIRQVEDNKNVLNMQYVVTTLDNNHDWIKSVLNVQIRLLKDIETDCRKLHQEIDQTLLDIAHNRI